MPKSVGSLSARSNVSAFLDTEVIFCGDNPDHLMRQPQNCVDLIYIDPPFNSNRNYEVFWNDNR